MPLPKQAIRRDCASAESSLFGCVAGSKENRAAVNRLRDDDRAAEFKKPVSEAVYWEQHRPAELEAAALLTLGDVSKLSLGQLQSIMISRFGRPTKAKSYKEDTMLAKATAAASVQHATCMPAPSPSAADGGLAGIADGGDECVGRLMRGHARNAALSTAEGALARHLQTNDEKS